MPYRKGGGNGNGGSQYNIQDYAISRGAKNPVLEKSKSVSYDATTSDQIFAISSDVSATSKESMPNRVDVQNTGGVPLMIMTGYETYSDDTSDGVTEYLHTMVMPGETFSPPVRSIIRTGESSAIMDGTVVDNVAPDSNEYTDSGENCAGLANTTDPVTLTTTGTLFRVGDLIRVENEVMEITAIDGGNVTVKRAMFGSSVASHSDATDIRFPFFNAYHDFDKFSVAQTDSDGKFKCNNFFGAGRAATEVQGIVPGSIAFKFYRSGYQSLGLSGIRSNMTSGLTAGGSYWFKISIDGGTAESINFTVDSSNVNFGGTNGVVSKIQTALDDKYNNSASNTFQQKSTVSIVNGDIRFTSEQRLSTSAIALTAGVDGASASYNIFAQQNGWFPALASISSAVAARLPDDVSYNRVTYATKPNTSVFCYDDGLGNLFGVATGTINYETGSIDFRNAPPNSEFVYSVLHTSVWGGKLNEGTADRINSLVDIRANTTSQKWNGSVKVRTY